jgi:hypothetical protein
MPRRSRAARASSTFAPTGGSFIPSMRPAASLTTARSWPPCVRRSRAATAGALAAVVWGLQEPLDQRLFRCDYSDIALLGKAVTRGRGWRAAGFAIHAVNGAIFGLAFDELRQHVRVGPRKLAVAAALGEHLTLYPLCYFVDRYHPARGEHGIPPLLTNQRAFAQATWRHALFGLVFGRLA